MRCSEAKNKATQRRRSCLVALAATALLTGTLSTVSAQDLGVIGPVYPIAEPSLLDVIMAKLRRAEASGVLGQLQRDARDKVQRSIKHPAALTHVRRTIQARTHYYDPTLIVTQGITDVDGRIIVAPGTTVNPLDTVSLSKHLLFFDGRDAGQLKRAQTLLDQYHGRVKLILTGGSYLDLMKRWQLPVFYDQQGLLTTKLNIRQVPALVYQEGRRLRIDEIL